MKKIFFSLIIIIGLSLFGCTPTTQPEQPITNEKIEEIIKLIDDLPKEITLEDKAILDNIQWLYDDLSESEKEKVTNYKQFLKKKEELKEIRLEKIEELIQAIDDLPNVDEITLRDEEQLYKIPEIIVLDEDEIKLVTNYNKFTQILEKIYNLLLEVELVKNSIAYLPEKEVLTMDDKVNVEQTRSLYDALREDQKERVENYNKLVELENRLVTINKAYESAQVVVELISNLPSVNNLTYEDKSLVTNARFKYNLLSAVAKTYVTNLDVLEAVEAKMKELEKIEKYKANALKIDELILSLPSINELTYNDRDLLYEVKDAYESLLEEEKVFVTKLNVLNSLLDKMEELINITPYEVYVNLNGGYIEGLIETPDTLQLFELNINNYSANIWTAYSTGAFIYSKSLMKEADSYTSFIKVGFSYDATKGKYVVNQIVKSGTALTTDLRTQDYYLLAHSDYVAGYQDIQTIVVCDLLTIDKSLPNDATSTLNANVKVLRETSSSTYSLTFAGHNTLPAPAKPGYIFVGWYLDSSFTSEVITEVSESITVYAKWTIDKGEITTATMLNCVSDIATSNNEDILILENDEATFTWKSSNNKLYTISNGVGKVSKVYQTHKNQTVTITLEINYKNGSKETRTKEITVAPVLFNAIKSTPVSTYFYTGAISGYKKYNERYQQNQTLFSETTKEALDIINYSFLVPKKDGTITIQDTTYISEVNELKEHDVRVIAVVNGVGSDTCQAFMTIAADATLRAKFIKNLMDLVEKYNFDGVDIDWEAVSETLKPNAKNLNLLIQELREEMNRRQDEGGSPYLLTMAVPASSYGTSADRFDFVTLNKYVDYINIMSYDLNNSSKTTHLSPLYSSSKDNGYGFGAVYGLQIISGLGFSKNKLIIGCAGYGKAYKVNGSSSSSTYPALGVSGTLTQISGIDGSFASGTLYGSAINALIKTGKYVQYTEKNSNGKVVGSYLYNSADKIFITYDSKEAVMAKYEYAASMDGVGIMCWAYTEDTSDTVINAIYEAMTK
jgi:chitinase